MNIEFFLNEFSATPETFILNQMVGLIRRGHKIQIHARSRSEPSQHGQHGDIERYLLLDHAQFYPLPVSKLSRLGSISKRLIEWGWRRPSAVLETLNVFRHGRPAWLASRRSSCS
jgi:colanic acid/amylovoran biosynthesis glycosyltransferase